MEEGDIIKDLMIFSNEEFGNIRTVIINNEPYFVGKDVATALGYERATKAIQDHVDTEDKDEIPIQDSIGRMQNTPVISESGLYALIFGSKLESAKRFKRWVTSEVLPTIRKTGGYQVPMTTEGQIRLLAKGHTELIEKIDKVDKDLQEFKQDMPLLALECQKITRAKNTKVVSLMGGKDSEAYKDNSLRGKVYRDIDSQLRREFGVNTYKAIKRNQCDVAIGIINRYELPLTLAEQIQYANSQMYFK